ncbi:uncharacterized protein LOC112460489 [Temnothorax curvispinosus]|uniref:Proteasome subunit alpha type-4 n=1 Tax=Temnothorax curvispinosus TaxID=300111 RepID=A0A6J1QK62_9HYME|nr:uncharacterized protein LOC112460489 [Temnothorax curvispinosus]
MEADLIVSCPYNPAHRIRKYKYMSHISKCKKTSKVSDKVECPLDKTHIVDRHLLKEHIATCSSLGKLINVDPGCEKPKVEEPPIIMNAYDSAENWEEEPEVPAYDPMEVSSKKPVLRCVSGLTKSERRKFRESERMRIANLKGFSSASAVSSLTKDTVYEVPLRPPRDTSSSCVFSPNESFDKSTQMDDHDDDHNTNIQAKFVPEFHANSLHRMLYDELAPEDDDIEQLEMEQPPRKNVIGIKTETKMSLKDYLQQINRENGNFSISNQNQDTSVKKTVEKTEAAATLEPFNIDKKKKERDECIASTSSVSGDRVTDKLLALLKNESSAKKVQPTEKTTMLEQMKKDLGEKEPALNEILSKFDDQLTYVAEIQNAAAEENARILQQLKDLILRARRYDTRTTIFSPEGRLYQVEYAMEAISHAGTCLGILANDGILLAAEKRNTNKLLDEVFFSEKIYKLNDDIVCSVAGITSDANVLTNELRLIAQRYLLQYGEAIPCEQLVSWLCDVKQAYTQYGGKRPFGVSILYMGWDKHYGYQLYQSDPSGNYGGWKATCIGNNSAAAVSSLKQEYKEGETTLKDAMSLAIKVLSKTLDMNKLSAEKVEMAILTREDGKTKTKILPANEVDALIAEHDRLEALAEQAKKEKQKS